MIIYYIIAAIILFIQLAILLEGYRHVIYTLRTYKPKPTFYHPSIALISPCKGIDTTFDRNINAFFDLDYSNFQIFFVVESVDDPALSRLEQIIEQKKQQAPHIKTHLLVAGLAKNCSQKLHNIAFAADHLPDDIEVLVFLDSDACPKKHFLNSLVKPLHRPTVGGTTGYRWFIPADNRLSSKFLSAMNAPVASMLGPHNWNSAWGGAMAIKKSLFDELKIRDDWLHSCSDDYLLTYKVKEVGLRIIFVPACFVASHEKYSWRELFLFARRQFMITRFCMPHLWWLALLSWGHYLLALLGGSIITMILALQGSPQTLWAAILPVSLLINAAIKALSRQIIIRKILPEERKKLLGPAFIDIFLGPVVAGFTLFCVLSAAGHNTIVWRGTTYRLLGHNQVEIEQSEH
ncbi:MAG: glycosyltransferase family 2 protein [Sedimentisphaerales bacterium]|nr:glycosyltransferase family 2 protein [Sedimentisphaerales bacterium]